jgi:hypothetical protein
MPERNAEPPFTTSVCLYFGTPDECLNCGGSASLGGTQEPLRADHGTYCSLDCHDEAVEFAARMKHRLWSDYCPSCGFDRHEHAEDCNASTKC